MSINFKQSAGLSTPRTSVIGSGKDRASVSFRLRINSPYVFKQSFYFIRNEFLIVSPFTSNVPGVAQISLTWRATDGNPSVVLPVNLDVVNHFVLTYDKTDPASQACYLNGVKTLLAGPRTQPLLVLPQILTFGVGYGDTTNQLNFDLEDFLFLNDKVLSRDEVYGLLQGGDPRTFGPSYFSMSGPQGTTPTVGDAGISTDSINLSVYTGPAGSSNLISYGPAMPFVSQTTYDTPVVCSSGKTVKVAIKSAVTGLPLLVSSIDSTLPPVIRIDGGLPITLTKPFYTKYFTGLLYALPPGIKVPKDAQVTMTVGNGWFTTSLGAALGMDGVISNKSGRFLYEDSPANLRRGWNFSYGPSYWHYERSFRNMALSLPLNAASGTFRADQTLSSNWSGGFWTTSSPNAVDGTGTPMPLGKWVVSWDDNVPSSPSDISIIPNGAATSVVELPEYRNNGDVDGRNKTRVYEVGKATKTYTLQGGCSDTATVLTLDNVQSLSGIYNNTLQQWIAIDGEYMDILAVNTLLKQITVKRGCYGTVAASHVDKSRCVMSWTNQFGGLGLQVKTPNYRNLIVLTPDDWDVPATPSPVVIERSEANLKGVSRFVMDSLVNGTGIARYMDSTLAFSLASEPEHMRNDSDLYWSRGLQVGPKFQPVLNSPVTPQTCPYIYYQTKVKNSEQFGVVLGTNLATAAAGTIETITIAGVFYGLRLYCPSGEILRVVGAVGDQAKVVRGAEGTTPMPQSAGPIMAGWRVPIASTSQLERPQMAAVRVTSKDPHGAWNAWMGKPNAADTSPLARIDISLLQPVNATDTVFSVSTSDASKIYLAVDLEIMFEGELVRVSAVGSGTITVARAQRGTTAAPHKAIMGKGRSGGVFCTSKDGKQFAWTSQIGWTAPYQVTGPDSLVYWVGVPFNQVGVVVGDQTIDTTPVMNGVVDRTYVSLDVPGSVCPYEHTARITNECPGAVHWFNLPFCGTNDLIIAAARAIRDTLKAGEHQVVVEVGNEIWNWGGPCPFRDAAGIAAMVCGYDDPIDPWVVRSGEVYELTKEVFAEQGRGDEVLLSLPWQQGGTSYPLGRARKLGVDVHVVSTAPYFHPGNTPAHVEVWTSWDDDQCEDATLFDFGHDTSNIGGALTNDGAARRQHEAITGKPLYFWHYEGGISSAVPLPVGLIPNGAARNVDLSYNPIRRFIDYDLLYEQNRLGGSNGMAFFNHCQCQAGASMWGGAEYHGQKAGRGDGSDGKADNTLCLATPGKPGSKSPLVNQAEHNVSVRLQADLDYQAKYQRDNAPPVPPPALKDFSLSVGFTALPGTVFDADSVDLTGVSTQVAIGTDGFYKFTGQTSKNGFLVVKDSAGAIKVVMPI